MVSLTLHKPYEPVISECNIICLPGPVQTCINTHRRKWLALGTSIHICQSLYGSGLTRCDQIALARFTCKWTSLWCSFPTKFDFSLALLWNCVGTINRVIGLGRTCSPSHCWRTLWIHVAQTTSECGWWISKTTSICLRWVLVNGYTKTDADNRSDQRLY